MNHQIRRIIDQLIFDEIQRSGFKEIRYLFWEVKPYGPVYKIENAWWIMQNQNREPIHKEHPFRMSLNKLILATGQYRYLWIK